jgi:hypothetical protein
MEKEENKALLKTAVERGETSEGKQRRRTGVIAKLLGARCEVEDVLLSSSSAAVLSEQERVRLFTLTGTIDDIVRRIEGC